MLFLMFSKRLAELAIEEVGEAVSKLGLDGVDLTVRPSGHVLPEEAGIRLPIAVGTLKSYGLDVPMITTAVTGADEPYAEDIFSAAGDSEVKYLKLGYWRYEGFGNVYRQLSEVHEKLVGIQKLAADSGVTAAVHVHSGDCMSGTADMVSRLLEGFDPDQVAAYIDPGHMLIEGGKSGWKLGMDLLSYAIRVVAVKDFGWQRDPADPKKWRAVLMPLSEGMVPWPEVFRYLKEISFDGPVSLHSEYEAMSVEQILSQTAKDFSYLKGVIASV